MALLNVESSSSGRSEKLSFNFRSSVISILLAGAFALIAPELAEARSHKAYGGTYQFSESDFGYGTAPTSIRYHRNKRGHFGYGPVGENPNCVCADAAVKELPEIREIIERVCE